jgi:hypothetical protein
MSYNITIKDFIFLKSQFFSYKLTEEEPFSITIITKNGKEQVINFKTKQEQLNAKDKLDNDLRLPPVRH